MSDTLTDPLPPLKPREKHARLEVDTFCVECGYNLHSQAVERDERLGIFVCRCPECGRFHPAGVGVTATKPWLARIATILLIWWVLIVLFAIFWIVMGMGAVQVAFVEDFTYRKMVAPDGREVEWSSIPGGSSAMVYKGTTQPAATYRQLYVLRPLEGRRREHVMEYVLLYPLGGAAIGFAAGVLLVIFFWHWKRRRYAWAMLLPLAVAAFVCTVYTFDDDYETIRSWAMQVTVGWAMWELVFMGLGILLGRPIARVILRMFVPPRPRQHFAFLWTTDGKPVPPASPAAV